MQQRRKVLILASTRKKHKEGITSVEDEQEEKASDNNKNNNNSTTPLRLSMRRYVEKSLSVIAQLYKETIVCLFECARLTNQILTIITCQPSFVI
jgi:hypothetical protein